MKKTHNPQIKKKQSCIHVSLYPQYGNVTVNAGYTLNTLVMTEDLVPSTLSELQHILQELC